MSWRDKRKTGIVVMVIGVICVGIGLLFNYFIPRSLQKTIVEEMCVSSVDHPAYEQWVNVTESTTKIYYWHIKNKEGFLYRREVPKLVERGPYVYTASSKKIDVKFDPSGKVTYKTFKQQKFNEKMTAKLCPTCKENDKLNIINMVHLGLMSKVKSADAFSLVFIPVALNSLLRDMDSKLGGRNATLKQLGHASHSFMGFNASCNPEFGSWFESTLQCPNPRCVKGIDHTVSQMRGLYNALTNPTVFGPPQDKNVYAECKAKPHLKACGLIMWLSTFHRSMMYPNATSPTFNRTEAQQQIKLALCPGDTACFPSDPRSNLHVLQFISTALRCYVLWFMDHNNYGLVTTRFQNELALGYVMDKFRSPPSSPNGVPSSGVLKSHSSYQEAVQKSDSTTLHSCNSSSEQKMFTWAAYNGASEVNQSFYPNASASEMKVRGHQGFFFPVTNVKSCGGSLYEPVTKKYDIFLPALKRRGTLVCDKHVSVKNLNLHRFRLDKNLVTVNNRTQFTSGLVDMSGVYGFPALVGFPHFLHGQESLVNNLGLPVADPEKHGSFIDIEPFTGRALHAVFRFQVSAVVSSGLVSSSFSARPLNISYTDDNGPFYQKVIPLFWTEMAHEVTAQQAKTIESEIYGNLRKSCGLVVVMSIAGGLCLFWGIALVALSIRVDNTVNMAINQD